MKRALRPGRLGLLALGAVLACSGGSSPPGGEGGGGGGGTTAGSPQSTGAPVAVSASSSTSLVATGSGGAGGGDGGAGAGGGDGGAGAGFLESCSTEWLPGAGGADGSQGAWPPRCDAGAPCYAGPPGSEGIGTCLAGAQECSEKEDVLACQGEVVPAADDCGSPENEACTRRALCGEGQPPVPRPAGDDVFYAESDEAIGIVDGALAFTALFDSEFASLQGTDHAGSAYLYGPSDAAASVDLVRISREGEILYSRPVYNPPPYGAAGDGEGNVLLVHSTWPGKLTFEEPITGEGEVALHRLGPAGQHRWSRLYGVLSSGSLFELRAFDVAPGGEIVVSGRYDGAATLGAGPLPEGAYGFVAGIDPSDGDVEWVAVLEEDDTPNALQQLPDGSVVVAGTFHDPISFRRRGFLAGLSETGAALWRREVVGDEESAVSLHGLAVFDDVIHFSGSVVGSVALDGEALVLEGASEHPLLGVIDFRGSARSLRALPTSGVEGSYGKAIAYGVVPFCGRLWIGGALFGRSRMRVASVDIENRVDNLEWFSFELPLAP